MPANERAQKPAQMRAQMGAQRRRRPMALGIRRARQAGGAAVEFALLASMFFGLLFGVLELARILYVFNTLQEVTRRAAALAVNSGFEQSDIDKVRRDALFRDSGGNLVLAGFVTPEHLKIDYLSLSRDSATSALAMHPTSPMPGCPAQNYLNCLNDPYGANCVRLVRVRVCQPGGVGECEAVPYQMLMPWVTFSALTLPHAATVAPAQTMGRKFGDLPDM